VVDGILEGLRLFHPLAHFDQFSSPTFVAERVKIALFDFLVENSVDAKESRPKLKWKTVDRVKTSL
jgi:hypothetical protein